MTIILLLLTGNLFAADLKFVGACEKDYAERSKELQAITDADQADRADDKLKKLDWGKMAERDLKRRKRVGEIFAEGCLRSAQDYFNAALVYQHGSTPEHIFAAYRWASRAAELDPKHAQARSLRCAALDRYIMDSGYKQIYATQAWTDGAADDPKNCFCLWPVEESATDADRVAAGAQTLAEKLEWLAELNKDKPKCPNTFCRKDAIHSVISNCAYEGDMVSCWHETTDNCRCANNRSRPSRRDSSFRRSTL